MLELNAKNHLSDFLIDSENKYGKKYIIILRKFIERQNNELENLIKKKIKDGKIDNNSANRINIQQIKEDEIDSEGNVRDADGIRIGSAEGMNKEQAAYMFFFK